MEKEKAADIVHAWGLGGKRTNWNTAIDTVDSREKVLRQDCLIVKVAVSFPKLPLLLFYHFNELPSLSWRSCIKGLLVAALTKMAERDR